MSDPPQPDTPEDARQNQYLEGVKKVLAEGLYQRQITRFALRCGLDRNDIDDVLQKTALTSLEQIPNKDIKSHIAWVIRTGQNIAMECVRARSRRAYRELPIGKEPPARHNT